MLDVPYSSWSAGPLLCWTLLLVSALFLVGCVKTAIEDEIEFSSDGSGRARVTIAIGKKDLTLFSSVEEMTRRLQKEAPLRCSFSPGRMRSGYIGT